MKNITDLQKQIEASRTDIATLEGKLEAKRATLWELEHSRKFEEAAKLQTEVSSLENLLIRMRETYGKMQLEFLELQATQDEKVALEELKKMLKGLSENVQALSVKDEEWRRLTLELFDEHTKVGQAYEAFFEAGTRASDETYYLGLQASTDATTHSKMSAKAKSLWAQLEAFVGVLEHASPARTGEPARKTILGKPLKTQLLDLLDFIGDRKRLFGDEWKTQL
ncbi:MAG: hypothetical protein ACRCYY_00345 [Trueperaceae bacterium]